MGDQMIASDVTTWMEKSASMRLPLQTVRRALIPKRVLGKILLVVFLGIIPRTRFGNLGDNFLAYRAGIKRQSDDREIKVNRDELTLGIKMLLLNLLCHAQGNFTLFRRVVENRRAIFLSFIRSEGGDEYVTRSVTHESLDRFPGS